MSGREEKAAKKAARERLAWYHDAEARRLALRLEEALVAYRREEIDVFQLDDVVAQYRRARRQLDYFCWHLGALSAVASLDQADEPHDWWEAAVDRRRQRS